MDLYTEKLLAGAVVGALAGYLLHRSPLLGAALGAGSTVVLEKYMATRYPDTGLRPLGQTARPPAPSVLPPQTTLVGYLKIPVASAEPEVGWVGQEALDPIHRALWVVDHGEF